MRHSPLGIASETLPPRSAWGAAGLRPPLRIRALGRPQTNDGKVSARCAATLPVRLLLAAPPACGCPGLGARQLVGPVAGRDRARRPLADRAGSGGGYEPPACSRWVLRTGTCPAKGFTLVKAGTVLCE